VGKVQEMLAPEGVFALLAAVIAVGAREWRRVQTAREKRRVREQELLAEMVAEVAGGGREVQVHHGGTAGTWSLTGTGSVGERRDAARNGMTGSMAASRRRGRSAPAGRRR
jgi:membrane protein implicated in regulation of membrane protease activity